MDIAHGQGATKERRNHGTIVREARAGRLGQFGHAEKNPLLLDKLRSEGFLGSDYNDQEARHTSGYKLRELWYGFNASASQQTTFPNGKTGMYEFESDDPTAADEAEQSFNDVMRCVPSKYHKTLYAICIDDNHDAVCRKLVDKKTGEEFVVCDRDSITDALDALHGAFRRIG